MVALRTGFDRQLTELDSNLLRLADMVESQLMGAMQALASRDLAMARRIDIGDAPLNKLRYQIEEQAYTLLALQQPTAGDMRRIVAAVSIATNLERMGDHAAGIVRLLLRVNPESPMVHVPMFQDMARLALENLRGTMDALRKRDAGLAREIVGQDEQIDRLHRSAYDLLLKTMISDPNSIEYATMLLWVSHNLERFADRICNICERVIYEITGNLYELRSSAMK